jgi:hypothetical protein
MHGSPRHLLSHDYSDQLKPDQPLFNIPTSQALKNHSTQNFPYQLPENAQKRLNRVIKSMPNDDENMSMLDHSVQSINKN